ncbi:MAG: DUF6220 domain-containing protein [Gemmatimonadaceae bacterium]
MSQRLARASNLVVVVAAIAQFYTAGLAAFGAASFVSHARTGWLVQLACLCTLALLLIARAPFRVTRFAILVLLLAVLQPILAFAPRDNFPWVSALHPLNGLAIVAVSILIERRFRSPG